MTYSEKLLDPRWQKKRLEILNRDKWSCTFCGDIENTLHIHHIAYSAGNPWDIDNKLLTTLCKDCHETETNDIKSVSSDLINSLKKIGFNSNNMFELMYFFHDTKEEIDWVKNINIFEAIKFYLRNSVSIEEIIKNHQEYIETQRLIRQYEVIMPNDNFDFSF